ncbi:hypothetical protein BHE74_00045605 [Ensete ventricosum]|nr:hypothetical protein BHE74_00045605 [Ensete ventricosum]
MYRERGGCGSKVDIGAADRKRINDALDRHLERSSPSTSRGLNGKEKGRLSMPSVNSGKQPEHRTLSKSKLSDEKKKKKKKREREREKKEEKKEELAAPDPTQRAAAVVLGQRIGPSAIPAAAFQPSAVPAPFSLSAPCRPASSSASSVIVATAAPCRCSHLPTAAAVSNRSYASALLPFRPLSPCLLLCWQRRRCYPRIQLSVTDK